MEDGVELNSSLVVAVCLSVVCCRLGLPFSFPGLACFFGRCFSLPRSLPCCSLPPSLFNHTPTTRQVSDEQQADDKRSTGGGLSVQAAYSAHPPCPSLCALRRSSHSCSFTSISRSHGRLKAGGKRKNEGGSRGSLQSVRPLPPSSLLRLAKRGTSTVPILSPRDGRSDQNRCRSGSCSRCRRYQPTFTLTLTTLCLYAHRCRRQ